MHTIDEKKEWLIKILLNNLSIIPNQWFKDKILQQQDYLDGLNTTFSLITRFIPDSIPILNEEDLNIATAFYPSYNDEPLNCQQLCRLLMLLQLPIEQNQKIVQKYFENADINEQIILYKGLFWLDNAPDFVPRLTDGIRTNIVGVFDAIALCNPFPFNYLPEDAWNQMVLKAIFMGRPLYRIYKLQARNNQKLALILHDFIHERWSAGRTVSPEVWQLMPGFMNDAIEADMQLLIKSENTLESISVKKALNEADKSTEAIAATWKEIGFQFNHKTI